MYLQYQYDLVRSSRQVLLQFCGSLSLADFTRENSNFGRGSIRNLLVHVGNTYEFWIGKQALRQEMIFTTYESVNHPSEAAAFFETIDALIGKFIDVYTERPLEDLQLEGNGSQFTATPLQLFSHVITHEFHHKGQILSFSRHLGYTPVDTDIMR